MNVFERITQCNGTMCNMFAGEAFNTNQLPFKEELQESDFVWGSQVSPSDDDMYEVRDRVIYVKQSV